MRHAPGLRFLLQTHWFNSPLGYIVGALKCNPYFYMQIYRLYLICIACIVACVAPVTFALEHVVCICATRAIMSFDELVYLGILAASIPAGFLFRYLSEYFSQMRLFVPKN